MRHPLLACAALATLTALHATAPANPASEDPEARVHELIQTLDLLVLPGESGYLGLIGQSAQTVPIDGHAIAIQSQVYYLLTRDRPVNYLHWLVSNDTHILIEGGPVDYFIFHPDGRTEKVVLGRGLAAGQRPVVAVPGNCWKALRLHPGASYVLMANALSPEWTQDRVKIGAGEAWLNQYRNAAPLGHRTNPSRPHRPQLEAVSDAGASPYNTARFSSALIIFNSLRVGPPTVPHN